MADCPFPVKKSDDGLYLVLLFTVALGDRPLRCPGCALPVQQSQTVDFEIYAEVLPKFTERPLRVGE